MLHFWQMRSYSLFICDLQFTHRWQSLQRQFCSATEMLRSNGRKHFSWNFPLQREHLRHLTCGSDSGQATYLHFLQISSRS